MSGTLPLPGLGLGSQLVSAAIGAYQRWVSPYKGFCCAYRKRHGRASCSQFARRAVLRRGVMWLPALLRRRFGRCAKAAQALARNGRPARDERDRKRAVCDGPDPWTCDAASGACEAVSCEPDAGAGAAVHAGANASASACDAGACDAGACDAGACDAGGCDGCAFDISV